MRMPTRRFFLQGTAAVPFASARAAKSGERGVYDRLGVRPVINGMGVVTVLGGSLMPPEVITRSYARFTRGTGQSALSLSTSVVISPPPHAGHREAVILTCFDTLSFCQQDFRRRPWFFLSVLLVRTYTRSLW